MSRLISSGVLIRRASRKTCWPSTTSMPSALSADQDRHLDQVDAERLVLEAVLAEHRRDLAGDLLGDARLGVEGAAQGGDAGAGALGAVEPRVEQLVVLRGRAEVPEHGLAAARQHREPDQLVHRPGADVGGGEVADVGEVEGEQAAEVGRLQVCLDPGQPLGAQAGRGRRAAPSPRRWARRCGSPSDHRPSRNPPSQCLPHRGVKRDFTAGLEQSPLSGIGVESV